MRQGERSAHFLARAIRSFGLSLEAAVDYRHFSTALLRKNPVLLHIENKPSRFNTKVDPSQEKWL
jgi:hypothetical protein